MTTLRNIIGGLDLEQALTSREEINQKLRVVLDEATGKWGIKVNRVESARDRAAGHDPGRDGEECAGRAGQAGNDPASPKGNGSHRSCPPAARRNPRSCGHRAIARLQYCEPRPIGRPRCSGRKARRRRSPRVFSAIHAGQPDQALLAYQYMQMLPAIARGDANKVWVVPSELNDALKGSGQRGRHGRLSAIPRSAEGEFTARRQDRCATRGGHGRDAAEEAAARRTVEKAIQEAQELRRRGPGPDGS